MKFLLTSAGINNALIDLLGKPIVEARQGLRLTCGE